ncbi:MAG: twin-arginine translocase TatA/TatE family subunit [Bacteroidota bacterium]|nr:twin-arginine translocase TatA/TatE family subunit [Bacteroidota bacterium]
MNLNQSFDSLLFLDISGGEILLVIIVIFVVFGPSKIPEIARTLGKGFNEVRNASNQIKKEINQEVNHFKSEMSVDIDIDEEAPVKKPSVEETDKK